MRLRGLDISAAQGLINFDALPSWVAYLFIKATEGTAILDADFARNKAEAHRRGIPCSPYHFCRPSQSAVAQARRVWDAVGDVMPDFRVALDLENAPDGMTPKQIVDWFLELAEAVEADFGAPPIVYTFPWFEKSRIDMGLVADLKAAMARCPLWMADYAHGESPPDGAAPFLPEPWSDWTFWQTSGNGSSRVPGIADAVDHDLFNGDAAAFARFRGIPDATPTDPDLPHLISPYDDETPPPEPYDEG